MTIPTNGITREVIRDVMPPYELSTDLLEAMFSAVRAPPPEATVAWRQVRAARLVQELAGLMPADAPQARIAAEIVMVREATDDALACAIKPGVTLEQACRLRRTASGLMISVTALERTMVRHQQKPVPFFGTVLADAIDIAAIAAGWGGPGLRREDGEALGGGAGAPGDGPAAVAGTTQETSAQGQARGTSAGDATTNEPAGAMEPGSAMPEDSGPDDDAASGGDGEFTDGPDPLAVAGAFPGVVTRLNQGPGWTLDVCRPRRASDVVGGEVVGGEVGSGDGVQGDGMHGDGVRGDGVHGDGVHGDGAHGDGAIVAAP